MYISATTIPSSTHTQLINLIVRDFMVFLLNACIPPILRSRMVLAWPRLPRRAIQVLSICASRDSIVVPEETTTTQFRQEEVDNVPERAGFDSVGLFFSVRLGSYRAERVESWKTHDIEPVHIGFRYPSFHNICDLLGRTNSCCTETTNSDMLAYGLFGPFGDFGGCLGPAFHGGSGVVSHQAFTERERDRKRKKRGTYRMALLST